MQGQKINQGLKKANNLFQKCSVIKKKVQVANHVYFI